QTSASLCSDPPKRQGDVAVDPCMTTAAGVKRQRRQTRASLCSDPPKRQGDVAVHPRVQTQGLALLQGALLFGPTLLMTENSQLASITLCRSTNHVFDHSQRS